MRKLAALILPALIGLILAPACGDEIGTAVTGGEITATARPTAAPPRITAGRDSIAFLSFRNGNAEI